VERFSGKIMCQANQRMIPKSVERFSGKIMCQANQRMIPKSVERFSDEIMRQAKMSSVSEAPAQLVATATLRIDTPGVGFTDITGHAVDFIAQADAGEGLLLAYLRHTSASLTIQENADPDVQADLTAALARLAPEDASWIHDVEGPDDMPAHVKAMLNGVSLHVPVSGAALALGTWQGIYLVEHRRRPHSREVVFQFIGSRKSAA
jgi:secondary thiamine-phosphate synthase enzyme